jgi:tetratricopeptide (TPR) repeat protein
VQRALFARLSVFVGGCSLPSAQAVCDPAGDLGVDVLDVLSALVDQSLVRQEDRTGEPRFRMLETVREFAAEQLAARGEVTATRERHAGHFLIVAEAAAPHLTGVDRARWLDLLEGDHDNFRAAIAWSIEVGDAVTGCRLLAALWRFWQSRSHLVEGAGRADAILALPALVPPAIHARAHEAAGGLAWWAGDMARVQREYEEAVRLAREVGEPRLLADALYNLSFPYSVSGTPPDSQIGAAFVDEAVGLYRGLGDEVGLARAVWALGNVQYFAGDFERVRGTFTEALTLSRKVGDTFMTAWALHMLGSAEVHTGHLVASWMHLREAIGMMRAAGETTGLVLALDDFGDLAAAAGDIARAARLEGAARSLEDATGTRLAGISARLMARSGRSAAALPPDEIARFAAEGSALTLDAAVELALDLPRPDAGTAAG